LIWRKRHAERPARRLTSDKPPVLADPRSGAMDFAHSPRALALQQQLRLFMADLVLPSMAEWHRWSVPVNTRST